LPHRWLLWQCPSFYDKEFKNVDFVENLTIYYRHFVKFEGGESLLRSNLKTMVCVCSVDYYNSTDYIQNYFCEVAVPVIESVPNLELLSIEFDHGEPFFDDHRRDCRLNSSEVIQLKQCLEKYRCLIETKTTLKMLRVQDKMVLLKNTIDKKLISHKAELVSKSYVACVLDYRSSVIRHAIFAMDVFTQVPNDIVNKERIHSEMSRIKDDWAKFKRFYEVIKPLAATDPTDISSLLGATNTKRLLALAWKLLAYATALGLTWATYHTTLICNSLSKASQYASPGVKKRLEKLPLSSDPNQMMRTIGDHTQKLLWWNKDGKALYQRCIDKTVQTSRQNLRLMLIFNFIFCIFFFLSFFLYVL